MLGHTIPQPDSEYIFRIPYTPFTDIESLVPVLVSYLSSKYRTITPVYKLLPTNDFLRFVSVFSGVTVNLLPRDEEFSHLPEIRNWFSKTLPEEIRKEFPWCRQLRMPISDVFLTSIVDVDVFLQLLGSENRKLTSKKLSAHYGTKPSEIYWSFRRAQEKFAGEKCNNIEIEICETKEDGAGSIR